MNIPHDEMVDRMAELDRNGVSILFCNGPQWPQSPPAIRELLDEGFPPEAVAYYPGGWDARLGHRAMSTQPRDG